ncbi:MAG TPA: tetratricopeptide repeat protein, partial [Anaerolineae bacterium]|nr:tetratricopeptide repeat protein [Anaerolineae bacterium]
AQMLIAQHNSLPISTVEDLLAALQNQAIDNNLRAQIQLINGHVARQAHRLAVASRAYQAALAANDPAIKAQAYFHLARTYRDSDSVAAMAQYARCRQHLQAVQTTAGFRLLAQSLIDEATIFIQQQPDLQRASDLLAQANRTIEQQLQTDLALRSDWHNTQGQLAFQQMRLGSAETAQHALQRAADHQWQAWQLALEEGDPQRILNSTHNLGNVYAHQGRYKKAHSFYESSLKLCQETGNLRVAAANQKGLGNCAVWLDDPATALTHYQPAYHYFRDTGNQAWQSGVCYDLAEACVLAGEPLQAGAYFQEGLQIANENGNVGLVAALNALGQQFAELDTGLNERQRLAINQVRLTGSINNKLYRERFAVSKKSAENDLRQLVEQGIFVKKGNARATRYELATPSSLRLKP